MRRVLLCDDDTFSKFITTKELVDCDVDLISCTYPETAVDIAKSMKIDYAFIDYFFPRSSFNGIQICEAISESVPYENIYLLTSILPVTTKTRFKIIEKDKEKLQLERIFKEKSQ